MRVFYIFNIKQEIKYLYEDCPSNLFNMLKQIYFLNDNNISYGKTLFNQLVNKFDKTAIDNYLFIKFHHDMPYSKRGDIHYINNLYKNEISRLKVKKAYIKLEIESNSSSFFEILKENKYLFACDFEYLDFFWLDNKKTCLNA